MVPTPHRRGGGGPPTPADPMAAGGVHTRGTRRGGGGAHDTGDTGVPQGAVPAWRGRIAPPRIAGARPTPSQRGR